MNKGLIRTAKYWPFICIRTISAGRSKGKGQGGTEMITKKSRNKGQKTLITETFEHRLTKAGASLNCLIVQDRGDKGYKVNYETSEMTDFDRLTGWKDRTNARLRWKALREMLINRGYKPV
jgi:hypothetical protein